MEHLRSLVLRSNLIELPEEVFADLAKLELVCISSNTLKTSREHIVINLKTLQSFHTNDNHFEVVAEKMFMRNEVLEVEVSCMFLRNFTKAVEAFQINDVTKKNNKVCAF